MLHKLASTTDIMVQAYIVPCDEVKTPHAIPATVCPWSVSDQATEPFWAQFWETVWG